MSGVAGVLLMYMNEEEAFWALCTILSDKRYAMHGLYIEGFPKLTRFLAHHDQIIAKFLPKLKQHFDRYNLDSILYSLKWFFVIFIERVSQKGKHRPMMLEPELFCQFISSDSIQLMFTSMGHISLRWRTGCYRYGVHNFTSSQK